MSTDMKVVGLFFPKNDNAKFLSEILVGMFCEKSHHVMTPFVKEKNKSLYLAVYVADL